MNIYFRNAFTKAAAHILAEESMTMDDSEKERASQAYLENSYDRDAGVKTPVVTGKRVVKEESTRPSNSMYLVERF